MTVTAKFSIRILNIAIVNMKIRYREFLTTFISLFQFDEHSLTSGKINMNTFLCFFEAYLCHPEVASAKKNRDLVMKEISEAIRTISGVAQFVGESDQSPFEQAGPLAKALSEVLVC